MSDDNQILTLGNISKSFGGVRALREVSFDLNRSEVHALVGENGAGKSTLIKIMTGAQIPDSGTINVDGNMIERMSPSSARDAGIAVIYQQPALFPDLSVAENIALRVESKSSMWRMIRWNDRREQAARLLKSVGATFDPGTLVSELSMPQQQLVEIAAALGAKAKILILDEPTASLSEREAANLLDVVRRLRGEGVGIIYISHRLDELAGIADRVTVLRDGTKIATRYMTEVDRNEMIRLMVGRSVDSIFPKIDVPIGDVVLETRSLTSRAAGIGDINFAVRAGEIVGLGGLVGAGRTELAGVLFGLSPIDSGEILLRGKSVAIRNVSDAIANGISYLPEDRRRHGVILDLSIASNTTLASLSCISRMSLIDFEKEHQLSRGFVSRLGTKTPTVHQPVGNLSGGNQQKVALSRWLATEPSVLILDEPTQGVDVGAKAEIHRIIGELARQGMAIILISSELPELLGMCDRIAVMRDGRIEATLDRSEATQERVMAVAFGHSAMPLLAARGERLGEGQNPAATSTRSNLSTSPHPASPQVQGEEEEA